MEIKEIKPRIFFVKFEDPYQLTMSTLRIEAEKDYPSYIIKNRKFAYEDYMDWYVKTYGDGHFTADRDAYGFCMPSLDFRAFMRIFPKSKWIRKERELIKLLNGALKKADLTMESQFCVVVAYHGETSLTFKHEMAHALFYADPDYRKKVIRIVKKIKPETREQMLHFLNNCQDKSKNIDSKEFQDEVNARMASDNNLDTAFANYIKNHRVETKKAMSDLKDLYRKALEQA